MPTRQSRTKRRKPTCEIVWYAMLVDGWTFDYHFEVNAARHDPRPYWELRALEITGDPIRPSKLKADKMVLHVSGDSNLADWNAREEPKRLIGLLDLSETTLRGHVWVPADALPLLLQLVIAGEMRYAVLRGEKLRYRSASAFSAWRFSHLK